MAEGNPDAPHAAFIREIPTGRLWQQPAMQRVISIEWAADGRTLLFTVPDELGRPYKVLRTVSQCYTDSSFGLGGAMHAARTSALGSEAQVAEVVMEEADPKYFIELQRTKDWEFLAVNVNSKLSSEVR